MNLKSAKSAFLLQSSITFIYEVNIVYYDIRWKSNLRLGRHNANQRTWKPTGDNQDGGKRVKNIAGVQLVNSVVRLW
jgi:hypothetical protein